MATKYAVATGNWSATTTWNGGTLPTSADDVYANTFTVTIDQDISVRTLQTLSTTGVTAGGSFTCSTARTITTSAGIFSGSTTCLTLSHTSGTTITVNSSVRGSDTTLYMYGILINNTGTTIINGGISGGGFTNGLNHGLVISANANVTITGNITASPNGSNQGSGIYTSSGCTLTITGNVTGGGGNNSALWLASNCTLNLTGTINASNMNVSSRGTVEISGTSNAIIIGSVYGSNSSGTYGGIQCAGGSTATVIGALYTSTGPAIVGSGTYTLSGPFYSSANGVLPILASGIIKLTGISNNEFRFAKSTTGTTSLFSGDVTSLSPSPSDVRAGTTFGVGNAYIGTMSVPSASSVAAGAYVDNTVGTAALSLSTIAALTGAQISAALST